MALSLRSLVALGVSLHAGAILAAAEPAAASRKLISVAAPQHDPLFVDADSVLRHGAQIRFKYLLDVLSPDDNGVPNVWRSNEVEAAIDCSRRTVSVRKLTAYSGPRGSGTATAVHSFTAPGVKPQPITAKSTFAYLEAHLCGKS